MANDEAQDRMVAHKFEEEMNALEKGLEEINAQTKYVLCIFLLCSTAGVFNSWHILVSNFYAFVPPHYCKVPELEASGWTSDQIRAVSSVNDTPESSCFVVGWNYTLFAELGYEKTLEFISNSTSLPEKSPCKEFFYNQSVPFSTVVSEWDLVCGRRLQKSHVQGSIAVGKFIGGLLLGFMADKYGRRFTFLASCAIYFVFGVSAAFTDTFWIFLICRFFVGTAGAGCYESGFTLMEELISKKHRAALGCMYNLGYPIGHMTLPGLALLFSNWRHLQLAISLPLVIFLLHFWLLPESPRWLLVHNCAEKAWKIVKRFNKNYEQSLPVSLNETIQSTSRSAARSFEQYIPGFSGRAKQLVQSGVSEVGLKITPSTNDKISISDKLTQDVKAVFLLFSTCELCKRISISIFNFFVASLIYYVIALNATNFDLNQYWYTFISGCVAFPGYISPLFIMLCMGRKWASTLLFLLSGLPLIITSFLPKGQKFAILSLVMFGRFTNVAVFGLVTVYCAELFPTVVRNSAVGVSLAMSQLGSIFAQYIVDLLGPYGWYIPSTICGVFAFVAALLILLLPETKGKAFLNTIEDVKEQPEKVSLRNCCKFS